MNFENYLDEILKLAEEALKIDNVPIGAIVVCDGKIIGKGYNMKNKSHIVTDHAEIIAINEACKALNDWRLDKCELFSTLEPCNMCKEVIKQSRIKKVNYLLKSDFYNENGRNVDYFLFDEKFRKKAEKYELLLKEFFNNKR